MSFWFTGRDIGGIAVLSLLAACAWAKDSPAEELAGFPSRVFDGDSFMLRVSGREVEIRLVDIDAPEHGQPYADAARTALDSLIWKERLRIVVFDVDRYHRKIGRAYRVRDGLDVNLSLVAEGHVWVYRRRVRDPHLYDVEQAARKAKRGLWALPDEQLVPPWRWRRENPREPVRRSTGRWLPSAGSASNA